MPLSRFRGTYQQRMDERGRMAVPARYRSRFEDGGVLIPGPGPAKSLWLYPTAEFDSMAERIAAPGQLDERARAIQLSIYSSAFDVQLDRQGRILIPPMMREEAGLSGSIIVGGMGDRLEVWSEEDFRAQRAGGTMTFAELLEQKRSEEEAS